MACIGRSVGKVLSVSTRLANKSLQPTVKKLRFLPSAELARYALKVITLAMPSNAD